MSRHQAIVGSAALAGLAVAAVSILGLLSSSESATDGSFDPEKWREASIRERGRMVRDLECSGRLVGLSADEVVGLLGQPDRGQGTGALDYTVDIGQEFASAPWTYALHLSFGDDGRVRHVELRD
jgi:hypothetical protein